MRRNEREQLLVILKNEYPDPRSELNFTSDYELLTAVILSAQCTDKKVNQITPTLFGKFPTFLAMSHAEQPQVEEIIRPINYYRTKAKHLIEMSQVVTGKFKGELPTSMDDLLTLPGVGRKTASVILSEKGFEFALAVDTHVKRLSNRLGLSSSQTPIGVEEDLCSKFERADWRPLHHWLILHGRRVCKAQNPACSHCTLLKLCPTGKQLTRRNTSK